MNRQAKYILALGDSLSFIDVEEDFMGINVDKMGFSNNTIDCSYKLKKPVEYGHNNSTANDAVDICISKEGKKALQAPTISLDKKSEHIFKARNNKVEIENPVKKMNEMDNYWVEENGTIRWSSSAANGERIMQAGTKLRDEYNFWIRLTRDPTFLSEEYSTDFVRKHLAEAGIKTGFFTVTVGNHSATQFFTQGKNAVAVYSKEQYDQQYDYLRSDRFLMNYNVGHRFKIGGKEYVLGDEKKLDIQYGEDIFDIQLS